MNQYINSQKRFNRGYGLIGIFITLVVAALLSGGIYYYLSKQISEIPEVTEKQVEEIVNLEEEVLRKEEVIPPEKEALSKKVIPSKDKPEVEITARPAELSYQNSLLISLTSLFSLEALAQITDQLQVEVRIQPPKEIVLNQTWTVGYTIKNITDSSFVLTYDIDPDSYKTSGAVVVDPDGNGPMKDFYYTFGREVSLPPKTEQFFDISLSPPGGLSRITPKIIFKGFSTQEPVFVHDFTVNVISPLAGHERPGCEKPICPAGKTHYDAGINSDGCIVWSCVTIGENCILVMPDGKCDVLNEQSCNEVFPDTRATFLARGWQLVDECPH